MPDKRAEGMKRIDLWIHEDKLTEIAEHAPKGERNRWINDACNEKLERERGDK